MRKIGIILDESAKIKINTDYDVRFGYTDSRGNFIEVGRKVAEDAFYKSWSQQTGGPPPPGRVNDPLLALGPRAEQGNSCP